MSFSVGAKIGPYEIVERLGKGGMDKGEVLRIVKGIAQALDYAHRQGVWHRDVKPSNSLLTSQGGVYIVDFGLARITLAGGFTLSQVMIMGTSHYISPEQARGKENLDGRTDVCSFGIVLYVMLIGRLPFQSDTIYAVIHSQIFDEPPWPSFINEQIVPAVEKVLLKALQKEPASRFTTADELASEFENAFAGVTSDILPAGAGEPPLARLVESKGMETPEGVIAATEPPALPDFSEAPSATSPDVGPAVERSKRPSPLWWGLILVAGFFIGIAFLVGVIRHNRQEAEASLALLTGLEIENNAYLADIYYLQGIVYLEQDSQDQALASFEQAAAHQPAEWLSARIDMLVRELPN